MPLKFIEANANGSVPAHEHEVVITFRGPKGGKRSIESLTYSNARALRDALDLVLVDMQTESHGR